MRTNLSSAVAGGEGLFNLGIQGNGILCLESKCPKEELIEVELNDDTYAAWLSELRAAGSEELTALFAAAE